MSRFSASRWSLVGMYLALLALVLAVTGGFLGWRWRPNGWLSLPAGSTGGQWVWAIFAGAVLAFLLHALRCRLLKSVGGVPSWQEDLRLVLLPLLAVGLFRPYITSVFFGGIDARSYGYGMMDVLTQARAGVFPVLVGQSEFMFEGVIHPVRTAPYHHWLGMLLDVLTCRALDPIAVQHLTVLVTAVTGVVMAYSCLVQLAPQRRELAWAVAALYVSAPAVAGFIYGQEMYMTFMAFAWLPLVLYGNIRLIREDEWAGWKILAAGLAVAWVCHAPVGLWLTIATGFLQGLRLLLLQANRTAWRRAIGGAALFAGFSVYYFWSMAEVAAFSPRVVRGPGANYLPCLLLAVGLAGLLRHLATGAWRWLVPVVAATVALWFSYRGYSLWLAAALGCVVIAMRAAALKPAWTWRDRLPEIAVVLILAGGLLTLPWLPPASTMPPLGLVQNLFPRNLLPLTERANALSDLQPGYALLGAWLLGVAALCCTRLPEVRLPVLAGMVGLALLVPVPGLTRFLLTSVPEPVNAISSVSLWLRYLPTLVVLFAFMGFLGANELVMRFPRFRRVLAALLCLALMWSYFEGKKFTASGYRAIQSTGAQLDFHRPENATQFAYIFSWMPVSPYLINGVAEYHLESRLLKADDPSVQAQDTVPWGDVAWQRLTGVPDSNPGGESWLNFSPQLVLAPGEYRLLRFRFFDRRYSGVLIMRGPRGWYRQYQLPDAGFGPKSFGVDSERPKTLALWNSSSEPQPVDLVFYRPELPADSHAPVDFAELAMLTYDPAKLPVRTLGLIPYRASVTLSEPAFLETPRAFIPGYRATVNGQPHVVEASPNHRAMLKLNPGENLVELRYAGTPWLWLAFGVSALTWCSLLAGAVRALYTRESLGKIGRRTPA